MVTRNDGSLIFFIIVLWLPSKIAHFIFKYNRQSHLFTTSSVQCLNMLKQATTTNYLKTKTTKTLTRLSSTYTSTTNTTRRSIITTTTQNTTTKHNTAPPQSSQPPPQSSQPPPQLSQPPPQLHPLPGWRTLEHLRRKTRMNRRRCGCWSDPLECKWPTHTSQRPAPGEGRRGGCGGGGGGYNMKMGGCGGGGEAVI